MANELFDKKIKEKLESVQRPVSSNVWDNIRKKIYVPWYFDFWRKYGLPLYSTMATVLLLVNLKDKFNYEKQFQLLNEKISTIQQIKQDTQVQTIVHRDTIYINKTIYVVQQVKEKPQIALRQKQQIVPTTSTITERPTESQILPVQKKEEESSLSNDALVLKEETKEVKAENLSDKDSISKIKDLKIPEKTNISNQPKKKFKWPSIDTRLGINVGYGFNQTVDLGPTFELFLGKSLSFSTGVSIFNHPESDYHNAKNFNMKTRQDFTDIYQAHLPPRYEQLEDIHIKASLLTIPFNINYYLPLNQKLDMKFSLGTNIDLRLYQNVKFESHIDGNEYYSSFNTEQKKGVWNNLSLGTGLQYKVKRYAFQLMPIYIYHYRETDFLSPKSNFRVNGSVLINLKKDK
ncbi:porin family protein [Emticicia fontis]